MLSSLEIATLEHPPLEAPFAIVDLADRPSLLGWIYDVIESQQPGNWVPLLKGTEFEARWKVGPALVSFHGVHGAQKVLLDECEGRLPGVFLDYPKASMSELAERLKKCLFLSRDGTNSMIRFYDPRVIAHLLAVLDAQQHALIAPAGSLWYWQEELDWKAFIPNSENDFLEDDSGLQWNFRPTQVDEFTSLRKRAFADTLSNQYSPFVTAQDPRTYINDVVLLGEKLGFENKANIEKFLRILLKQDQNLTSARFESLKDRTDLTAQEKLRLLDDGQV